MGRAFSVRYPAPMTEFAQSLRTWRQARRFSQLDLALEAEVSARHISFLETGRARPSRDMIARLGDALHLPLSAQNTLLTHAGFAAMYTTSRWEDAAMAPIRAAIDHTLKAHAPYPAMALDRLWRIVRMNRPAEQLYGMLGMHEGASLLELMVSPALPQVIENWGEVAHHSAQRLRTESAAQGGVAELDEVARYLAKVPHDAPPGTTPVIPAILNTGTMRLSLFGTIAQFGTPEDVTLDAMKIELFFPADAESKAVLENLSA